MTSRSLDDDDDDNDDNDDNDDDDDEKKMDADLPFHAFIH